MSLQSSAKASIPQHEICTWLTGAGKNIHSNDGFIASMGIYHHLSTPDDLSILWQTNTARCFSITFSSGNKRPIGAAKLHQGIHWPSKSHVRLPSGSRKFWVHPKSCWILKMWGMNRSASASFSMTNGLQGVHLKPRTIPEFGTAQMLVFFRLNLGPSWSFQSLTRLYKSMGPVVGEGQTGKETMAKNKELQEVYCQITLPNLKWREFFSTLGDAPFQNVFLPWPQTENIIAPRARFEKKKLVPW